MALALAARTALRRLPSAAPRAALATRTAATAATRTTATRTRALFPALFPATQKSLFHTAPARSIAQSLVRRDEDDDLEDDGSLGMDINPVPALMIQKVAPYFSAKAVVDGQIKEVSLLDYQGKYLVLFFYPLDFTFVCPTEIIAFSDRAEEFRKLNCELLAISVDSVYTHLAFCNTPRKQGGLGKMNIPLVADLNKNISRNYGVLLEEAGISLRGLFVIDPKSVVRQITVNDLPVGRSVDEVLRLVQAFQYTDKHGEVCPANWTPGSRTIKPTPKDSQKYFDAAN
eukprot:TRINITY_DN33_c0_g1_i1.p1 TRINITY_DN33_c0_g1~~TRINITY_DN33_c0_g1_i1.p1  ORF type:complete len:286 (+),score=58.56 TRINITY_DN33_c0_g1_i1:55-912(+)